jgi:DNA-directed RNA polymerase subunit RPC12/RpoP
MMIFYCSICGKQAKEFSELSHEDCPKQKVIKAGHSISTMSKTMTK